MQRLITTAAIVWAAPWTLFGLMIGGVCLLGGGHVQRTGRVLEFSGGWAGTYLKTFPLVSGARAVTFGHVVLSRSRPDLDHCRSHELVHVRQYERWGPLFVPAYVLIWILLWISRRNPYLDHPFEREAFDEVG